jgi:hypothetical protein
MPHHRLQIVTVQDELPRTSARRPQLRATGQASGATPQLIIPAETGRVREGDPAADVVEWID